MRCLSGFLISLSVFLSPALHAEAIAPLLAHADPESGSQVFSQCAVCHSTDRSKGHAIGPNLWGIVGRAVASASGFDYSPAMQAKGGRWSYQALSDYLENPQKAIPGNRMPFAGVSRAMDRANLIAYLRDQSDAPLSLPAVSGDQPSYDGLPAGPGREAVYYTCRACHSLRQFTQQRMTRSDWDELLDTMVANNGMEVPEPWARTLILNYLSTHFTVAEHDWQGLPPGEGRAAVFQLCSACHSLAIVKQQGLSRDSWQETLEWMVEEQDMPEQNETELNRILDYLDEHYGLKSK